MLTDLITVAGQVFTLFLMMGVGFALEKKGWFSEATSAQVTKLLLYVVTPCIIVGQLQIESSMAVVRSMLWAAVGLVIPYLFTIPACRFLFRREHPDTAVSDRFALIYSNQGFMGLPLLAGILGEDALIFGVIAVILFNAFMWTQGVVLMGGKLDLKHAFLNPGIVSMAVGLTFFATGFFLPSPVLDAVKSLGSLNTPLAMVIIGAQISRSDLAAGLRKPGLYVNCALRLLVVPAITAAILYWLPLEPLTYCACVVLAACPSAGATAMFAQMFHRDEETASQVVSVSTLLSILTLPVFAVLARTVSGLAAG